MNALLLIFVAGVAFSQAQVTRLECKAETQIDNPFLCLEPKTCDDQACAASNRVCCPNTKAGECGYTCSVGDYTGCFETEWFCYGTSPVPSALTDRYSAPAFYIDNQDAVLDAGNAKEIEYYASRTGVEVEFVLLASADGSTEHEFRMTTFSVKHTATFIGAQKIDVNWNLNQRDFRFAFRTASGSGEFPIPFENNKAGSSEKYHSFIDPEMDGGLIKVKAEQRGVGDSGVNMRFQARICLNSGLTEIDDSICGYVPPTSSTMAVTTSSTMAVTTSPTVSATTGEGPDPICETIITSHDGCLGQAVVQEAGDITELATASSYTYIDYSGPGEIRQGKITFIEYRVTRLTPVVFQIWEEVPIPSAMFKLFFQMTLTPTQVGFNRVDGIDLDVQEKMRFGFTYDVQAGDNSVPIQYVTRNVESDGVETSQPYLGAECLALGCGSGLQIGDEVEMTHRGNLVMKQFKLRACTTTRQERIVCTQK